MDYFGVGVDCLFYFHLFKILLLGTENYTDKYLLSIHYRNHFTVSLACIIVEKSTASSLKLICNFFSIWTFYTCIFTTLSLGMNFFIFIHSESLWTFISVH